MADRRENHGSSVSILYFFRHFDFPKSTVHCTGLLFLFQAPLHKNLISAHEMRYDGKSDADATKLKPRVFPELNYTFWNTDVLLGSAHIVCSMFALHIACSRGSSVTNWGWTNNLCTSNITSHEVLGIASDGTKFDDSNTGNNNSHHQHHNSDDNDKKNNRSRRRIRRRTTASKKQSNKKKTSKKKKEEEEQE